MHARLHPARHVFRYPVWFLSLDLDELPELGSAWFGCNRSRLFSVREVDYLQPGEGSLKSKALRIMRAHGCDDGVERIELVTSARFFGHAFNPVSLFLGYRSDGSLRSVVAEVSNTFKERHVYVLPDPARASAQKAFHVSPFNNMEGEYRFDFVQLADSFDVRIDLLRDGKEILKTRWEGKAEPFSSAALARCALRPFSSVLMNLPRIHFEAARLFFGRKLKFFAKPIPASPMTIRVAPPGLRERVAMKIVLPYLRDIRVGRLKLILPDRRELDFGMPGGEPAIVVTVRDWKFFWRILKDGDVGFGESYMAGEWEADVSALITLFLLNRQVFDSRAAMAVLGRFFNRAWHLLHPNTLRGSRRNIRDHYDLSNDLYRLFLDPTMMYSCAIYQDPGQSLEEAQRHKLHELIRKAAIGPGDHVLEIGSGWGAFAIEAVRQTGCRVTTVTISTQQLALARQRVREAGLEDRISVELRDYRTITGQFDKIISIEMLEAVGHQYLGEFFAVCDRVLKPGGLVALQVITMPDERYESYRRGVDWIQKHIFPGGHLPSLGALREAMGARSRFSVAHLEDIGLHYARTLRDWRQKFLAEKDRVRALGFDETFVRKWTYYFSYCEAAFATRAIGDHHLVLTRKT